MASLDLIDAHVHLCRTPVEEQRVFPRPGWPLEWYWANESRIGSYMELWGISHIVIANLMDTRAMTRSKLAHAGDLDDGERRRLRDSLRLDMQVRVAKFNDWACDLGQRDERIIPFVMVDPVLFGDDLVERLDSWIGRGARGIKVHPNICGHFPDDRRMDAVYDLVQERELIVLTDTTDEPDAGGEHPGAPINWAPVLRRFGKLTVQLAHLPGGLWTERLALAEEFGDNLWFDTSQGFVDADHAPRDHRRLGAEQAVEIIRAIGAHRIVFGSDAPGGHVDVIDLASQLLGLPLADSEKEAILAGNAKRLLKL